MASKARLDRSRHGTLAIRFHWNGPVWEGTGLPDTPANRQHLEPICAKITEELAAGTFTPRRYLSYFPNGNRAQQYLTETSAPTRIPLLRDWVEQYLERLRVEGARRGTQDTYRQRLKKYVLPTRLNSGVLVGDLRLDEITTAVLLELRTALLRKVSPITAKGALNGGLRSALNEARVTGVIASDPFPGLPRMNAQRESAPDPFTSEERDVILAYFAQRRPHYYPFVLTMFHTGMRPSEATARIWSDFDPRAGTLRIDSSLVAGQIGAPKTAGSNRTIRLVPLVREVLEASMPIAPDPEAPLFPQALSGRPIDQKNFAAGDWARMLRHTKLRPHRRALYACRHTFLSIAVSLNRNFLWLAHYCGTSAKMIEAHYARYLDSEGGDQLEVLEREADRSKAAIKTLRSGAVVTSPQMSQASAR